MGGLTIVQHSLGFNYDGMSRESLKWIELRMRQMVKQWWLLVMARISMLGKVATQIVMGYVIMMLMRLNPFWQMEIEELVEAVKAKETFEVVEINEICPRLLLKLGFAMGMLFAKIKNSKV